MTTSSSPRGMDPTPTEVPSTKSSSSLSASCWQYEWKRPEWKQNSDIVNNNSIDKKKTKCLDMSSSYYHNHSNFHGGGFDDDDSFDNNSEVKSSDVYGDVLTVSLWEDDSLQYLVLQPPSSNSISTAFQRNNDENETTAEEIVWKWPRTSASENTSGYNKNNNEGISNDFHPKPLVSIHLCHVPSSLLNHDKNDENKKSNQLSQSSSVTSLSSSSIVLDKSSKKKKRAESSKSTKKALDLDIHQALDILDSLSFQQTTTPRNVTNILGSANQNATMTTNTASTMNINNPPTAAMNNMDDESDFVATQKTKERTDLALACTTSTGCVYLYRLRNGLLSRQKNTNDHKDKDNQEQQDWSDWILGSKLRSILTKEYLHWNHSKYCIGTYQLIPKQKYKSTNTENKKFKNNFGARIIESTTVTPHYLVLQQKSQSQNAILKSHIKHNTQKNKNNIQKGVSLANLIGLKWIKTQLPSDRKKIERNINPVDQASTKHKIKTQSSVISTDDTEIHDNRTHLEAQTKDSVNDSNSSNSTIQSDKEEQQNEDWWNPSTSENSNEIDDGLEKGVATNFDVVNEQRKEGNKEIEDEKQEDSFTSIPELPVTIKEEGCYLSFVSLQYLSETNKSVWIPFVPTILKPIIWNGYHLIIVLGDSLKKAVAIRVDPFPQLRFSKSYNNSSSGPHQNDNLYENNFMIFKFIPIPIHFDIDDYSNIDENGDLECPCAVTSIITYPPAIITKSSTNNQTTLSMYTLTEFNLMDDNDKYPQNYNHPVILQTRRRQEHYATIPPPSSSTLLKSTNGQKSFWCLSGQGWSLVGENGTVYFVSWEGATAVTGALTKEIGAHNHDCNVLIRDIMPLQFSTPTISIDHVNHSSILELPAFTEPDDNSLIANSDSILLRDETSINSNSIGGVNNHYGSFYYGLGSRHRSTNSTENVNYHENNNSESRLNGEENIGNDDNDVVKYDDIVIDALDSVKSLPMIDNNSINQINIISDDTGAKYMPSDANSSKKINPLNNNNHRDSVENSQGKLMRSSKIIEKRLLYRCSSWTQLDDTRENRALIDGQLSVGTIFLGNEHFSLRLRRNVVTNGIATPFPQVLSWLCQNKDYYTAASIALNLLHDFEAVRDLRGHIFPQQQNIHYDSSTPSYLDGLLDGIIPLDKNDFLKAEQQFEDSQFSYLESNNNKLHNIITSLADMTVGCLVRGGVNMSLTLHGFLGRNIFYDASRACLMLTACANTAVEQILENENSAKESEADLISLLWPIQCLLRVAVVRDCMRTAIILLNGVIPNVLRRHPITTEGGDEKLPSLNLCKSIISMILDSTVTAASILLDIVEEDNQESFWQSLQHDTQLEFSLITSMDAKENDYYPFLYEYEVRMWALEQLAASIQNEYSESIDDGSPFLSLPEKWLKNICYGCLLNAGCNIFLMLQKNNSSSDVFNDIDDHNNEDCNVKEHYTRNQNEFLRSMEVVFIDCRPSELDFNLLIPALLLLQKRSLPWHTQSYISTQSLLCFVCDLAGKPSRSIGETKFGFDGVLAMKQCGIMENVMAGAHLIGGHEGLVLQCVDILMNYAYLSMNEAESILLYGNRDDHVHILDKTSVGVSSLPNKMNEISDTVVCEKMTEGHKRLLWLIEKHVLSIEKYGDLEPCRGKINPDFAALTCLRAWVSLNQNDNFKHFRSLLSSWLQTKLLSPSRETCKNKLACAVLVRVLLWPTKTSHSSFSDSDDEGFTNEGDYSTNNVKHKVLAELLEFDLSFLIDLSIHCRGMVQSVPPNVADDIFSSYIQKMEQKHANPS